MTPKPNYKRRAIEAEGKLKLCRDGIELLKQDCQGWKELASARQDILDNHKCPKPSKWYGDVNEFIWICFIYAIGILAGFLATYHIIPEKIVLKETIRYVVKIPDESNALKSCHDAWREDERELRKLRKELHADH